MNCQGCHVISLNLNKEKLIEIKGCCKKQHTIATFPFQYILNQNDILGFLNNLHSMPYENQEVYELCYPNKLCTWFTEKIEQIDVNTLKTCNLRCIHCKSKENSIDLEEKENYFKLLYKIKNLNLNYISLTGKGEPFFYKEETFDYLRSLTINDTKNVQISTNATLLDKEDIEELLKIQNKSRVKINICVSIDGLSKEVYEKIRVGGNFEKVISNIVLLNEKGLLKDINFCVQRDNYSETPNVFIFFRELGLKNEQITIFPCETGDTFMDIGNRTKMYESLNIEFKQRGWDIKS